MRLHWIGRLVAIVAAGAAVGLGMSKISLEVDVTALLPPDLPETAGYRLLFERFVRADELLILLEGEAEAVRQGAQQLGEELSRRTDLAREVRWQPPLEADPQAAAEFVAWALLSRPPAELESLERSLSAENVDATLRQSLQELEDSWDGGESLLGYDPLGLARGLLQEARQAGVQEAFASRDGRLRLLQLRSPAPPANYREAAQWLSRLRGAAEAALPEGVTLRFTGEPAFLAEISMNMERDMRGSALLTLLFTALVVWLALRDLRLIPLLLAAVLLVFVLTLSLSGLMLGGLTVLTIGFASILIGLSADYGILLYQAARRQGVSALTTAETRRGIQWAAATTAASFFSLVPAGMPGLADLGLLVGLGVLIGLGVFLGLFPRMLSSRWAGVRDARPLPRWLHHRTFGAPAAVAVAFLVAGGAAGLLWKGPPAINADGGALRPRHSEAYEALDLLTREFSGGRGPVQGTPESLSLLITGADAQEVAGRLDEVRDWLERARAEGQITSFLLPDLLWPRPQRQEANLRVAASLAAEGERLRQAVWDAGFSENATALAEAVFSHWRRWLQTKPRGPFLPDHPAARDMVERLVSLPEQPGQPAVALGSLQAADRQAVQRLRESAPPGTFVTGQKLLNQTLEDFMARHFPRLALLFGGVTVLLLAWALRHWRPLLVTAISLGASFVALIGCMSWLGLTWNAFTLPALLLSLGTGSDYFIHVILDLERRGGGLPQMRTGIGQGLLVCSSTSVIGFGSLSVAATVGLANLGMVCALAIALNVLVAVLLMPWLWLAVGRRRPLEK